MSSALGARGLALASLLLAACDASGPGRTRGAVIGGAETMGDPAVVALVERAPVCVPDAPHAFCTGILVGDKAVITAAHCLDAVEAPGIDVVFGSDTTSTTVRHVVGGVIHPGFHRANNQNDIAVLTLESAAPVAPMPYNAAPLDASLIGSTVRVVGFGDDGMDQSGTKRTGTMTITEVNAVELRLVDDTAMTCAGDSGGPVLLDLGNGETLIGVTAWGDAACNEFGVAPRVDAYLDEFLTMAITDAERPTQQRPAFDSSIDFCSKRCSRNEDCPDGTVCVVDNHDTTGCALGPLPIGNFTDSCNATGREDDCLCMTTPVGCRCFDPCGDELDEPDPDPNAGDSGCGIASQSRDEGPLLWCVMMMMLLGPRFRRRHGAILVMAATGILLATVGCKDGDKKPAASPMTVAEIQPTSLNAKGGQILYIIGEGFDPRANVTVRFGDKDAPRAAVMSATKIQVELPPGTPGTKVKVVVSQPTRKTAAVPGMFSYLGHTE